jgi:hypothetical protein
LFTCISTVAAARAEEPAPALALVAGAAVIVAGLTTGSMLLASSDFDRTRANAGWLTIESGFTLAPWVAHAVVGEWARGVAFAAPPGAMLGATEALFQYSPGTVASGSLPEQRWMWGLFGVALASSGIGVVDVLFAPRRAKTFSVAPSIARDGVGLQVGGAL